MYLDGKDIKLINDIAEQYATNLQIKCVNNCNGETTCYNFINKQTQELNCNYDLGMYKIVKAINSSPLKFSKLKWEKQLRFLKLWQKSTMCV